MNTGSRVLRTLARRSKAGDSNTTSKDRRSHWTGSRPPSSQSNWPQGRIQCRKILDQSATEGGVTSSLPPSCSANGKTRLLVDQSIWLEPLSKDYNIL